MRDGFRGTIHATPGTFELCKILLPDSAHLQEEDAAFANRHGTSKHKPALPLYTGQDAADSLTRFKTRDFDEPFELASGVRATLHRAGHVLGAAFLRIETPEGTLTFTGDLGRPNDPLMNPPALPAATDYLVTESTYGDRVHPQVDPEQELANAIHPALARGGAVIIPAFAVGRTQTLLLLLARLKAKGTVPDAPVFVDSPMAVDATALYQKFHHEHRIGDDECRRMCSSASMVTTPEGSKELDRRKGPMIILSASGMATGGRVVHHLKAFAPDERNLILLAGFQAAGTRGAALAGGATTLRMHGQEVPIRAEVAQLKSSSAHADSSELIAWLGGLPSQPRRTFITHGEPGASDALRQRIERELHWTAEVPEHLSTHELV